MQKRALSQNQDKTLRNLEDSAEAIDVPERADKKRAASVLINRYSRVPGCWKICKRIRWIGSYFNICRDFGREHQRAWIHLSYGGARVAMKGKVIIGATNRGTRPYGLHPSLTSVLNGFPTRIREGQQVTVDSEFIDDLRVIRRRNPYAIALEYLIPTRIPVWDV